MGISNALNNRPVRTLGFLTAFHSVIYGIGYLTATGGFNGALVGLAVNNVTLTNILGVVLLTVGLLLMFAYMRQNPKTIYWISCAQAIIWLFIGFMYLVNGAFLLALGIGFAWAVASTYIGYASANRQNIMAYDQTEQAMQDTKNEDKF